MRQHVEQVSLPRVHRRENLIRSSLRDHAALYLMVIPGVTFFLMFRIYPILGSVIAWKDYSIFSGIWGSEFVGWKHFQTLFTYPDFRRVFANTLSIGLQQVVFAFPAPIAIALLINEVRSARFKKVFQTIVYLPHFLSWVVVGQLAYSVLDPQSGIVNTIIEAFGGQPIFFMARENLFQPIAVLTYVWKEAGYFSVVYFAAISSIDPGLYESATIDGAGRLRKIWWITLPLIVPTAVLMLLLQLGRFLEIGFDHIWNLLNPVVWSKGDILNTYIFRVGLQQGRYSLTTAMGLFKSVVGFILIMGGNALSQRLTGKGFFSK
jgi:putative aldouronate transport system permease protein